MRTTVTIDNKALERAMEYTGITEKSTLLNHALRELIHREASRRLALMGGSEPDLVGPPRGRFEAE